MKDIFGLICTLAFGFAAGGYYAKHVLIKDVTENQAIAIKAIQKSIDCVEILEKLRPDLAVKKP